MKRQTATREKETDRGRDMANTRQPNSETRIGGYQPRTKEEEAREGKSHRALELDALSRRRVLRTPESKAADRGRKRSREVRMRRNGRRAKMRRSSLISRRGARHNARDRLSRRRYPRIAPYGTELERTSSSADPRRSSLGVMGAVEGGVTACRGDAIGPSRCSERQVTKMV